MDETRTALLGGFWHWSTLSLACVQVLGAYVKYTL